MKKIVKEKYINKEKDGVLITFDDDSTFVIPTFKNDSRYQYTDLHNKWIADGGITKPQFTGEELLTIEQSKFRANRNLLLKEADIEINKLDDKTIDSSIWRAYRQALRDSTIAWVLPAKP